MRFVTIIPWQMWIIALALLAGAWWFGLPGFVIVAVVLLFLH